MLDCCIIGGGIIGLSIARELAGRGHSVRVLARECERDTASWAGAGILPPTPRHAAETPGEILTAWSDSLHRQWARELFEETGIDNGLASCGGLHVAGDASRLRSLASTAEAWRRRGARCLELDGTGVVELEPGLRGAVDRGAVVGGIFLPDETQIRPPRHLEALVRSCKGRGVEIMFGATAESIILGDDRIEGIAISREGGVRDTVHADAYCLAAGAWSGALAEPLGLRFETRPIRGQIALFRFPAPVLTRVVNSGLDYLLPRSDGRLLVGSTLEDVGFDRSTTAEAIDRLRGIATALLGDLSAVPLEQVWAGLRPGSIDGLPTIGRTPNFPNGYVATGHFRAGLHQSTGTAALIADMITGAAPTIDPEPFAPDRPRRLLESLMPR
ncbi:MAG: NAD(P)/FAD-dependent oxidoreductase [Planctomycetia bacterium]